MTPELLEQETEAPISTGEEDVRQFLSDIRHYPRLSAQEERDLARRCMEGDEDAIRHMVNSNLRLVVSLAREYAGRGVPLLDLIQEGSIGLLVAARKFDYTLEFRFSPYATKWIRQGITRCILNHAQVIRVPAYTAELIRKVESARNALLQENGTEPSIALIGEKCGMSEDRVWQLMLLNPEICSLDSPAGEEEEGTLGLLLEDARAPQPQEELVRQELANTMNALLGNLSERQQTVLRLHFGMEDGTCYSLEEISGHIGVSKERVRQIEKQAMDKLQKLGANLGLEDFLNE